jgi:hypothetical protein
MLETMQSVPIKLVMALKDGEKFFGDDWADVHGINCNRNADSR